MVDSNDRDRVDAARDELHRMLNEDELRESILLVFANKQVSYQITLNFVGVLVIDIIAVFSHSNQPLLTFSMNDLHGGMYAYLPVLTDNSAVFGGA